MYNEPKEKQTTKDRDYKDDEIDLSVIVYKIGSWIKGVINSIAYTMQIIRKRLLLVILFVVAGLGVGYFIHSATKPYYTSSMTLILADIRNEFVEDQLTSLTEMVEEDNYEVIAKYLEIPVDNARQIKKIEFINLDQNRIAEDSILVGSPFKIELMLYNNSLFDAMEPALINFLESNRYFLKQKNIRQRQVENLISKYKGVISSIDSVKESVIAPRGPVSGFVYGEPIDPTNLYREGISMYEEQVKLEAELARLDNIEIVNGFTPRSKPSGPSLLIFLAIGALFAFLISIIVAINIETRNKWKHSV